MAQHGAFDIVMVMPLSTVKIPEVTRVEDLERAILAIPEPRHYFTGITASALAVPTNVLLFHRRSIPGHGMAHHQRHVLIIAARGSCGVLIDDALFRLEPQHALLVFPFQFHGYQPVAPERSLAWMFITFEGAFHDALAPLKKGPLPLGESTWRYMRELLRTWHQYPVDDHRASAIQLLTALLLNDLLAAAEAMPARRKRPRASEADRLLGAVCRHVQDQMHTGLGIKEIAKHLRMAPSTLRLGFRRQMGRSLGHYLRDVRMLRAASLLRSSDLRLRQIAERCGMDSEYSLSRAFKREMGVSPRAYRQRGRAPNGAGPTR
jgi:AraC-like DNA-binding protein